MGFVHGALLWLGLAALAPVVIHLLSRRRLRVVELPTVRFIVESAHRGRRRTNLRHLVLLALRVLAVLAAALVIARPVLRGGRAEGAGGSAPPLVLLIDDSFSMLLRKGARPVFEEARAAALEALDTAPPGTPVLLCFSSSPAAGFWADAARARPRLLDYEPAYKGGAMWALLARAGDELKAQHASSAQVFCFSDMTAAAWPVPAPPVLLGASTDLYLVDVGAPGASNTAVTRIRNAGGPIFADSRLLLEAEVHAYGAPARPHLLFSLDGRKELQEPVDFAAPGVRRLTFPASTGKEGTHVAEANLSPADAIPEDNDAYYVAEVPPAVRVLVIDPTGTDPADTSPSFFLRLALEPWPTGGAGFAVRRATADQAESVDFKDFDLVVLAGVAQPTETLWRRLRAYVVRGGGLAVLCGPTVRPDAYNAAASADLLPARIEAAATPQGAPLRMRIADPAHAFCVGIGRASGVDVSEPRFATAWRLAPVKGATTVLAFDAALPALVERRLGGLVLMFASSLDDAWGDSPRWPGYLPFVYEMCFYLSRREPGAERNFVMGDQVPLSYPPSNLPTRVLVRPPGGKDWAEVMEGATPGRVYFWDTSRPGLYRTRFVRSDRQWEGAFAVSPPPGESDPTRADSRAIESAVQARRIMTSSRGTPIAGRLRQAGRSGELTPLAVLALFALLAAESALANRFYGVEARAATDSES